MGKVLIATFRDDEEIEELILFLKQKSNIEILDNISTDKVLIYEGLEIDPIYRVVRTNGMEIEMTNLVFSIYWREIRDRYSPEDRFTHRYGAVPIMGQMTVYPV